MGRSKLTVKFVESKMVKIKDIGVDPMNPNTMTKAQHDTLKNSINEFKFLEDIILNDLKTKTGQKYTIIGGHQRVYVLQDMGEEEVPAKIIKTTALKARRLGWAMNRNMGHDDQEKLSNLLLYANNNDQLDAFVDAAQFDIDKAKLLIDKFHDTALFQEGDDIIPETLTSTKTKIGDVYQLGQWVYCSNCNKKHWIDEK